MAGRPLLTALKQRIEKEGLEDQIFEALADGLSIGKMCEKFKISSRKMFYDWKKNVPSLEEKWQAAKKISAEAHVELAEDALDKLAKQSHVTSADVALTTQVIKYRQWLAGVRDKDQYGPTDIAKIQINIGDLHMEALQSQGARPQIAAVGLPALKIPEAEYEEIEGESSNDGEADALRGTVELGPSTPLASPSLALELGELL